MPTRRLQSNLRTTSPFGAPTTRYAEELIRCRVRKSWSAGPRQHEELATKAKQIIGAAAKQREAELKDVFDSAPGKELAACMDAQFGKKGLRRDRIGLRVPGCPDDFLFTRSGPRFEVLRPDEHTAEMFRVTLNTPRDVPERACEVQPDAAREGINALLETYRRYSLVPAKVVVCRHEERWPRLNMVPASSVSPRARRP